MFKITSLYTREERTSGYLVIQRIPYPNGPSITPSQRSGDAISPIELIQCNKKN